MKHLNEEALILVYYGEPDPDAEQHLASCEECRAQYQRLQRELNTVDSMAVPERGPDYEGQVWKKLAPRLGQTKSNVVQMPAWRFVRYAAIAAMLVVAFFVGKSTRPVPPPPGREALLALAVGEHLERAQLILAQLANDDRGMDIAYEQGTAEDLVQVNRLYRLAAVESGDHEAAELLDRLERSLLEIAHTTPEEIPQLRLTIRAQGILAQVRDFESRLRMQL